MSRKIIINQTKSAIANYERILEIYIGTEHEKEGGGRL